MVVDVEADMAMDRHRWRHLVYYRRVRPDLSPFDLPLLVNCPVHANLSASTFG